jgi:hypothetical protein
MLYKIAAVFVIVMGIYETIEYFHIDALMP